MRRSRALAGAVVVGSSAVLVAAGCGGEDASGPSAEVLVRRTVVSWYAAVARGEGEKACALMTEAGRRRDLAGGGSVVEPSGRVHAAPASCEAQVEEAADGLQRGGVAAELGAVTIGRVSVLDDQATATADFAQRRQTLVLRRVAGRWLVDGARG